MNILITGANGFLGSNISNLLSFEHNVFAVSRSFQKLNTSQLICIRSEMTDYIALDEIIKNLKIDAMIHCAWMGGNSSKDINELWQTENIFHSIELLELCAKNNIKHFIGFGSSAEYGYQTKKFDENTYCNPDTMYGVSKYCFKSISENYCKSKNIKHSWVRPVYTYGPNDVESRLIPKTILTLLKNQSLTLNKCSAIIDYLFVEDFARAIKIIVEEELEGSYTICSDEETKVKDAVELIYKLIKPDCDLVFDDTKLETGHPYICGSSAKLRTMTDWMPEINFEEGIKRTISYFKKFV